MTPLFIYTGILRDRVEFFLWPGNALGYFACSAHQISSEQADRQKEKRDDHAMHNKKLKQNQLRSA